MRILWFTVSYGEYRSTYAALVIISLVTNFDVLSQIKQLAGG